MKTKPSTFRNAETQSVHLFLPWTYWRGSRPEERKLLGNCVNTSSEQWNEGGITFPAKHILQLEIRFMSWCKFKQLSLNSTLKTERWREDRSIHHTQSHIYILSLTSALMVNKLSPAPETTEPNPQTARADPSQSSWFHFHHSVWIRAANQTQSHLTETLPDASCAGFLSVQTNRRQFVTISFIHLVFQSRDAPGRLLSDPVMTSLLLLSRRVGTIRLRISTDKNTWLIYWCDDITGLAWGTL